MRMGEFMNKKIIQAFGAFGSPLLTLGCTSLAARYIAADDPKKAAGAALAGLVGFALTQIAEDLPKRSFWWRQRFDARAAFEGWWLQIHDRLDRVAVTSLLYDGASDKYLAEGNAFNTAGDHLAHWESTEVFFSTGSREVNYLWKGISYDQEAAGPLEGSTRMSLDRASGRRRPVTGHGNVQHLNLARVLQFRTRRITPALLEEHGLSFCVDDLGDFDLKKQLARAFLARAGDARA
jgi:hypothetical protein